MEEDDDHGGGHAGEGRPGAGSTAAKLLYKAIQEDDLETIRRLVEGKDVQHLRWMMLQRNYDMDEVESQQVEMPFLVLATLRQNKRVIRYLLSQGVENVNVRDEASGNTPLHYAIMMVDGEEEDGRGRRMRALASLLRRFRRHLPPHAWLGRKGRREDTGEEGTEEERQMDMVTFLLYLGANPTAKNKKGNTPLMELARFQAHGRASPSAYPSFSLQPHGGHCFYPPLFTRPEDVKERRVMHGMLEHMLEACEGVKREIDAQDMWGRTALFIAADALNYEAVKTLLRCGGADPTIKNHRGETILDLLISGRGHHYLLPKYRPVRRLLEDALSEPLRLRLVHKARFLNDDMHVLTHLAATASLQEPPSAAFSSSCAQAPAYLHDRLKSQRAPLPHIQLHWNLPISSAPSSPSSSSTSPPPAPPPSHATFTPEGGREGRREEALAVLDFVVSGQGLKKEHFDELMHMLQVRWDPEV